ncbi:MAG TPA: vitamin K epoxide reductase family protein, partial [Bacteroidota bacterium]
MTPLIILLSLIGLFISLYFALVHHNILRPDTPWIPSFCRLDEKTCGSILRTPEARLFRVPNFYFGITYYIVLIILSWLPFVLRDTLFEIRIISGFTVFIGIILTHSLIWRLKVPCVLC